MSKNQEIIVAPDKGILHEPSMATRLAKVEFDQQIETARAYPRSIEKAVSAIATLATLDQETAQECMYVLPRDGKQISGPSARLAEIIASQWGNNRVAARVVHVDRDEGYIEAEGIFHDLETNSASTSRVRRNIRGKGGRVYSDDMIIVTGNAACSIAKRNAILGGVPKGVWRGAYSRAQAVIRGDAKTLVPMREQTMAAFKELGVSGEAVLKALGVRAVGDIKLDHIVTLRGMYATIKNQEATVEEMFGGDHPVQARAAPAPAPEIPDAEEDPNEGASKPQVAPAAVTAPTNGSKPTAQATPPSTVNDLFPGDKPSNGEEAQLAELQTELNNCESEHELTTVRTNWIAAVKRMSTPAAERARKLISDAIEAAT